jgi:hypothetical protein
VIALSRSLARQFRVFLRCCWQPPGPREPPLLRLQVGPQGLELAARQHECTLLYRQAGSFSPEALILRADLLADIEGKDGMVNLAAIGDGKGEACWNDGGVPRVQPFDLVSPDKMPELPVPPARFKALVPGFLPALAEAARTTARDGVRFALMRIQLQGRNAVGRTVAEAGGEAVYEALCLRAGFCSPLPHSSYSGHGSTSRRGWDERAWDRDSGRSDWRDAYDDDDDDEPRYDDDPEPASSQQNEPRAGRWGRAMAAGLQAAAWWLRRRPGQVSLLAALAVGAVAGLAVLAGHVSGVASVVMSALGLAYLLDLMRSASTLFGRDTNP